MTHTFEQPGKYTVSSWVIDEKDYGDDISANDEVVITVTEPESSESSESSGDGDQELQVTIEADKYQGNLSEVFSVNFTSTVTDDENTEAVSNQIEIIVSDSP